MECPKVSGMHGSSLKYLKITEVLLKYLSEYLEILLNTFKYLEIL